MKPPIAEPCPGEDEAPHPAPGPVGDTETLVRFVSTIDDTVWDGEALRLSSGSLSRDDIRGARGTDGKARSVSTFRKELTPPDELLARASTLNSQPEWSASPVVALAVTEAVRKIHDATGRREFCVHAEPIDEKDDPHGLCPTHAGAKRSKPERPNAQRVAITILRDQIANVFGPLRRLRTDGSLGELATPP